MRDAILSGEFETIMVLYNPLDEENTGREILALSDNRGFSFYFGGFKAWFGLCAFSVRFGGGMRLLRNV